MNALGNPVGTSGGVQREQTMEEILASIRKIIESNEAMANPLAEEAEHYKTPDADTALSEEIAEDTADETANGFVQPEPRLVQPVQIEVAPYVPPVAQPVEAPVSSFQSEMARLVSQSPERRVAAAFDDLNSAFVKAKQMPIEGVAEAMLKPMLQDWLDNNLPNLVERLVREEISRIARGDI